MYWLLQEETNIMSLAIVLYKCNQYNNSVMMVFTFKLGISNLDLVIVWNKKIYLPPEVINAIN